MMCSTDIQAKLQASKASKHWQNIGIKHHHGINIPLFSLRTLESAGIGEYLDLIPMIDWISSLGMDVIQLMPLNDTGMDSSPYNALSAYALNPIHISLAKLPHLDEKYKAELLKIQLLNDIHPIPHMQVRTLKEAFLRKYYNDYFYHYKDNIDYLAFLEKNVWLIQYAQFRTLKDKYEKKFWKDWPVDEQYFISDRPYDAFYIFIQYLCHLQFSIVSQYARKKNILLMGDLPILISRDSHDVWAHPELFHQGLAAGAPPDMYSSEGQYWGFPVYNWSMIEKDNYQWWKKRLEVASSYYDIFRIDHVVGFFRIWSIPFGKKATEGHFEPQDENLWIGQGEKIMNIMLESSTMLPIGEDLGVVPTNVRSTLKDLGISGTKVMRWERVWNEDGRFIPIKDYIPQSLTTVSTHDSDTLALWWQNAAQESQFYAQFKGWLWQKQISRDQQISILKDSHHTTSLFHVNLLQEYLTLFKDLSYENPADERINIPGTINDTNWCYRFKPTVEEIVNHKELKDLIKEIIE
jgi:4-alpha-glucanotransferase